MKLLIGILAVLWLVGCSTPAPEPVVLSVPADLRQCLGPVVLPAPPPVPRTVERLVAWAGSINAAAHGAERARSDCAGKLGRLNLWIEEMKL